TSGHRCVASVIAFADSASDAGGAADGGEGPIARGVCSPHCDDLLCSGQQACDSPTGTCAPTQCSKRFACADQSTLCDPVVHGCFPENGMCGPDVACPTFDF